MISKNDIRLKNAYRKKEDLLTSDDIVALRKKYAISQSDLCSILGWGEKTITRYEGHYVQDRAHDMILRKIDSDPAWFLYLLKKYKGSFSEEAYSKYLTNVNNLLAEERDIYLRSTIEAMYSNYSENSMASGNAELSLDKVVDVIRYLSYSENVDNLFKVKLMKMLWYADALSYKRRDKAITGMVYKALPMGAVPEAHNLIVDLNGVSFSEVDFGDYTGYHFSLCEKPVCNSLSIDEISILDAVIEMYGKMTKSEIVDCMHKEKAYINTPAGEIISFKYAKDLVV